MAFDINQLTKGRNVYGRVGGNIANMIGQRSGQGSSFLDPRLAMAGYSVNMNSMDENPSPSGQLFQFNNQDKWNNTGTRIIDGKQYHQIGDFFGDGRNQNEDDIRKIVKDPSKIIYDDEAGLLIDDENLLYRGAQDDLMDMLIKGGILAGSGAVLGNAFGLIGAGAGGAGAGAEAAGATGAFDTAGWAGTGINGSTGVSAGGGFGGVAAGAGGGGGTGGLFGNAASGVRGGGSFLSQLGASLGISPDVMGTLNTVRQGAGLAQALGGIFGGGGTTGRGGSSGGGMDLMSLLGLGAGAYQDNRNIQQYESQINNLLDRGDPFRNERANYITRLNELYADPSSIEKTPGYQFAKEQGLDAIQRKMAARGMSLSGNELGEMDKFSTGLAAQTLDKERAALMQMAGANFNPADMAGRGIQAYGNIAQMQANRNAGVMNGLFGNSQNGNSPAGNLLSLFKQLFPNSGGGSSGNEEDILGYFFGGNEYGPGLPDIDNWDFLGG